MGGSGKPFVDEDTAHVLVVDHEDAAPGNGPCGNLVGDGVYDSILFITLESNGDA